MKFKAGKKAKSILKKIGIGAAAAAGVGGVGYAGHQVGFHRGASKMSTVMGEQFKVLNARENNSLEQNAYQRGLADGMAKSSSLEKVALSRSTRLSALEKVKARIASGEKMVATGSRGYERAAETGSHAAMDANNSIRFKGEDILKNNAKKMQTFSKGRSIQGAYRNVKNNVVNKLVAHMKNNKIGYGIGAAGAVGLPIAGYAIAKHNQK